MLADPAVLLTLPPRQMRAGYAEVAKYGLLGDAAFFARLERDGVGLVAGTNLGARLAAIETAAAA